MGGRGGDMGMGMGGGPGGPSYKALWMPSEPVHSQATNLGMEQQDLSVGVPLWKDGPDGVNFTTHVRWELIQTGAILPDTLRPFPSELWNVGFGTSYRHLFDNGWTGGASISLGSASDQPFYSLREATVSASGTLRVPQGERNAWIFSPSFSTNSQVLYNIPIPGVMFFYNPNDNFQALIGFPFARVNMHPWERWRFELTYALLTTFHGRAIYQPAPWLDCYVSYESNNESYLLVDRPVDNDRFYYCEQAVSGGVQFKFPRHVTLDFSAGYAFDRYYFEGTGFRVTNSTDQVDIGNGPYLAAQLRARF